MYSAQWFVECNPRDNESLARVLDEYGIGIESMYTGLKDIEGKPHDVWLIPSSFLTRLRAAKRNDKSYAFRFWIRNGTHSPLRPAEFIEKRKKLSRVLKALDDLEKMRTRRSGTKK